VKQKSKSHLDASIPGQPLRRAYCGLFSESTETDLTKVDCAMCLRRLRSESGEAKRRPAKAITGAELNNDVATGVRAILAPMAGPPPRLDHLTWTQVCKVDDHRCKNCVVCEHEVQMAIYAHAAPHRYDARHTVLRHDRGPRWGSLNAAIVAYADYEAHDRAAPSATGFMLARAERGDQSDGGKSRPDDPQMARADDIVHVRQALEVAYPEGAHAMLTSQQCVMVLLARTPGATAALVGRKKPEDEPAPDATYEELSERLTVTVGDLKALVKEGRRRMTIELAARGLIPEPRALAEDVWKAEERRVGNG
jgi:hypothetical protein